MTQQPASSPELEIETRTFSQDDRERLLADLKVRYAIEVMRQQISVQISAETQMAFVPHSATLFQASPHLDGWKASKDLASLEYGKIFGIENGTKFVQVAVLVRPEADSDEEPFALKLKRMHESRAQGRGEIFDIDRYLADQKLGADALRLTSDSSLHRSSKLLVMATTKPRVLCEFKWDI